MLFHLSANAVSPAQLASFMSALGSLPITHAAVHTAMPLLPAPHSAPHTAHAPKQHRTRATETACGSVPVSHRFHFALPLVFLTLTCSCCIGVKGRDAALLGLSLGLLAPRLLRNLIALPLQPFLVFAL